ncbi:sigma-70 family RNA polymerase sigma factor [Paenibacillus psychroresistens]|uniref:Sigma-70 family RNA polymerase sigma factor n=1 Tax=Paenibacillus psychroresistens TaxID=1778678 RepID=A0A6B8RFD0_9BACL|nr:sigma-70 family RNA polymerase sigma factor [Paenibacillus psychroresistens]QGQ94192.1 sigma-70 family RNA polymerase sigma factor [Paenibacillus psychroresistens]
MASNSLRPGDDFPETFQLYGSMLYRIAIIHLGNKEDAEEALQETFMKLLYKSPGFNDQEHEKAWLIRVVTNHCKSMLRNLWRRRVVKLAGMDVYFKDPSERILIDNVMALPFKYKVVIHLYYYEDYTVSQIAEILQISESAVKMRLQRGRQQLKLELEGEIE